MSGQLRTVLIYQAGERTTPRVTATLEDADGTPVPGDQLMSLRLTYYEANSLKIINGRKDQDVLGNDNTSPTHGITVDGSGILTWDLSVEDTEILYPRESGEVEEHIAKFRWGDGTNVGAYEIVVPVVEMKVDT